MVFNMTHVKRIAIIAIIGMIEEFIITIAAFLVAAYIPDCGYGYHADWQWMGNAAFVSIIVIETIAISASTVMALRHFTKQKESV